MSIDELLAWLATAKGDEAPPYCYDENGIAQRAINAREWQRRCEWYLDMNDENPY